MSVEQIVDQIDDVLEKAFSFPLSGGKILVDGEMCIRDSSGYSPGAIPPLFYVNFLPCI